MFGGFKNLLLFIFNDPTKFTSKQLYHLRSFILESQKAHDIIIDNQDDDNNKYNILNINDDCINKIYKYSPQSDHISLSKTCHLLTIVFIQVLQLLLIHIN